LDCFDSIASNTTTTISDNSDYNTDVARKDKFGNTIKKGSKAYKISF